jgi:hypothetical protein
MSAPIPSDAKVGLGKRWRIVDAVAQEGNARAFRLKSPHFFGFVLRQNFGKDALNAELSRDHVSRSRVISRDHHRSQALRVRLSDRGYRVRFERVGNCDEACQTARSRNRDHGLGVGFVSVDDSPHHPR